MEVTLSKGSCYFSVCVSLQCVCTCTLRAGGGSGRCGFGVEGRGGAGLVPSGPAGPGATEQLGEEDFVGFW